MTNQDLRNKYRNKTNRQFVTNTEKLFQAPIVVRHRLPRIGDCWDLQQAFQTVYLREFVLATRPFFRKLRTFRWLPESRSKLFFHMDNGH